MWHRARVTGGSEKCVPSWIYNMRDVDSWVAFQEEGGCWLVHAGENGVLIHMEGQRWVSKG